jgi:hypothetical protein
MSWFNPSRKSLEQNIELFFQSSHPYFPGTPLDAVKADLDEFCGPTFTEFTWCTPNY